MLWLFRAGACERGEGEGDEIGVVVSCFYCCFAGIFLLHLLGFEQALKDYRTIIIHSLWQTMISRVCFQ